MSEDRISVPLSDEKREFIAERIASGDYADEAEVLDAALALLEKRQKIEILRALIAEGDDDFERGDYMTFDEPGELTRYIVDNAEALK
ncbi:MAG: type toxin-antitoxin system ParD family antitoxin [Rhizobium sp.]|nr:type toxin-antitoxin system ParD family antitoxin [Rhizobium sp.]